MKKIIELGLAVCLCFTLLCGCGKEAQPLEPTPAPTPEVTPTTAPEPTPEPASALAYDREKELAEAIQVNPDVIGWLVVPGTEIDEPVVQSKDNDYYLRRTWWGEWDNWGCYFGDYINDFTSRDTLSANNMIYGHSYNSEDTSLPGFTQLFRYKDIDFLRQNPCFYLYLPDGDQLIFQVVDVFYVEISFDYINPEPAQEPALNYYETVKAKNEYLFDGIDFGEDDKLMTLSTCSYAYDTYKRGNHRFVVMGKLLDKDQLPQTVEVRRNPDAVHPAP